MALFCPRAGSCRHHRARLASAKAPAKRKSRKLPAPWMAEMASEGAAVLAPARDGGTVNQGVGCLNIKKLGFHGIEATRFGGISSIRC